MRPVIWTSRWRPVSDLFVDLHAADNVRNLLHIFPDWHKAGKGPDPNKLELDQQLEAYRLASAASAAAETEMTA